MKTIRMVTYTLQSEPGTRLRASGWICDGDAGGSHWTGERYRQMDIADVLLSEKKVRWRKGRWQT